MARRNANIGDTDDLDLTPAMLATPSAPVQDAEEATEEISVLSDDGTHYVKKKVSVEEARVITSGQMTDRFYEGSGADVLNTDAYDPGMVRYWAVKDKNSIQTIRAFDKGYRPVRVRDGRAPDPSHVVQKVEGWDAAVVTRGDLVLMEIPRHIHDQNEYNARLQSIQRRNPDRAVEAAHNILDSAGVNDGKSDVVLDRRGRRVTEFVSGFADAGDRAANLAASLQGAREYQRSLDSSEDPGVSPKGRMVFGGYDGPMNHGAVPPSRMNITGRPPVK